MKIVTGYLLMLALNISLAGCEQTKQTAHEKKPAEIGAELTAKSEALTPVEAKKEGAIKWSLSAIEKSKLVFRNGYQTDTKLHDLQFIGQVKVPEQEPYLIYSGRYCGNCDARRMLYMHQAGEPAPDVSYGKNRLMHPGIMRDHETGEIIYRARTFYGQVLDNSTGVIWIQESLTDYGSLIPNIFLIKLDASGRSDTSMAFNNQYLQQTLALFEKGACKEIKGVEYLSEP